ncbi:helix-turn-helix domain-containing protein [Vibrio aphrogenes]|uniref:helix-turn-helix domain-containing protein n=1 Tax=Vibrio aphrogenes TaxID=1891186 RepID=UPI001E44CD4A|nr:helix-turn-helix transcriptional regulator [Vibrio aphrogenes]
MENVNMSIGEVLKERRIELSIKQEDLAERMGVTVQTVSKWERGITEPKASQVADLAKELKMNEKEICQGQRILAEDIDHHEFIKTVSSCIHYMPEIDLILTIYDELDNPRHFAQSLLEAANLPVFTKEEAQKEQAKNLIAMYEKGTLKFDDEAEKEQCLSLWNSIINK